MPAADHAGEQGQQHVARNFWIATGLTFCTEALSRAPRISRYPSCCSLDWSWTQSSSANRLLLSSMGHAVTSPLPAMTWAGHWRPCTMMQPSRDTAQRFVCPDMKSECTQLRAYSQSCVVAASGVNADAAPAYFLKCQCGTRHQHARS